MNTDQAETAALPEPLQDGRHDVPAIRPGNVRQLLRNQHQPQAETTRATVRHTDHTTLDRSPPGAAGTDAPVGASRGPD